MFIKLSIFQSLFLNALASPFVPPVPSFFSCARALPTAFRGILVAVDNKQYLILRHISTLFKKHIFQIPFYTGTDFYKLLGTDTSYIFTIDST